VAGHCRDDGRRQQDETKRLEQAPQSGHGGTGAVRAEIAVGAGRRQAGCGIGRGEPRVAAGERPIELVAGARPERRVRRRLGEGPAGAQWAGAQWAGAQWVTAAAPASSGGRSSLHWRIAAIASCAPDERRFTIASASDFLERAEAAAMRSNLSVIALPL